MNFDLFSPQIDFTQSVVSNGSHPSHMVQANILPDLSTKSLEQLESQ